MDPRLRGRAASAAADSGEHWGRAASAAADSGEHWHGGYYNDSGIPIVYYNSDGGGQYYNIDVQQANCQQYNNDDAPYYGIQQQQQHQYPMGQNYNQYDNDEASYQQNGMDDVMKYGQQRYMPIPPPVTPHVLQLPALPKNSITSIQQSAPPIEDVNLDTIGVGKMVNILKKTMKASGGRAYHPLDTSKMRPTRDV